MSYLVKMVKHTPMLKHLEIRQPPGRTKGVHKIYYVLGLIHNITTTIRLLMIPMTYVKYKFGCSKNRKKQNGWFIRENPIKMADLGVPPLLETSTYLEVAMDSPLASLKPNHLTQHPSHALLSPVQKSLNFMPRVLRWSWHWHLRSPRHRWEMMRDASVRCEKGIQVSIMEHLFAICHIEVTSRI